MVRIKINFTKISKNKKPEDLLKSTLKHTKSTSNYKINIF